MVSLNLENIWKNYSKKQVFRVKVTPSYLLILKFWMKDSWKTSIIPSIRVKFLIFGYQTKKKLFWTKWDLSTTNFKDPVTQIPSIKHLLREWEIISILYSVWVPSEMHFVWDAETSPLWWIVVLSIGLPVGLRRH